MRVLILCAGDGARWGGYLGVPKQLAPVDGVPILHRTVRLLRDRGVDDIRIVVKAGQEATFTVPGALVETARLDPRNHELDRCCSSRHLWSDTGRTVVLYGDVYYTGNAMDTIVGDDTCSWRVYGRPKGSKITGCTHGELFAFSWWPDQHKTVDNHIAYVVGLRRTGTINRALGWELYRALLGHTGRDVRRPRSRKFDQLVVIDDATDDFDKPKNYDTWHYRRSRAPDVAVLVPWRGDGGHRDAAWAWARDRWQRKHPRWRIVEGHCPDDGPWSKGTAIADALARTDATVLVLADADVWCGDVDTAVDKVATGQTQWAVPHRLVHRLSEAATGRLLAGDLTYERIHKAGLDQPPYVGYLGGGITVIARDLLDRAPVDRRFTGWGHEDEAAAIAWATFVGKPWRGGGDLWHLYHPPQPRLSRSTGSDESMALLRRYKDARRWLGQLRKLLAEIGAETSSSLPFDPPRRGRPVKFVSTKYPDLHIPTIGVRFRDGVADVTVRGAVAYLRQPRMRSRGVYLASEAPAPEASPAETQPGDRVAADAERPEPQAELAAEPAPVTEPDAATEPVAEPAPDVAEAPAGDVPDGTAVVVLDWVGDDAARAQAAVDAEQRRDKPRTSLISKLTKITG